MNLLDAFTFDLRLKITPVGSKIELKDVKIYNISKSSKRIELGNHKGNKFEIIIRDIDLDKNEIEKRIISVFKEMEKGIPNLFGPQRFGDIRPTSHLIGKEILKGNFEKAVKIYLCDIFEKEGGEVYFAELYADLDVRLKRNKTQNRLDHKPIKKDLEWSEKNLLNSMDKFRMTSQEGEITRENYIKIDNSNLSAEDTAKIIKDRFNL